MRLKKLLKSPSSTQILKLNCFDLEVPAQFTKTTLFHHSSLRSLSKCLQSPCQIADTEQDMGPALQALLVCRTSGPLRDLFILLVLTFLPPPHDFSRGPLFFQDQNSHCQIHAFMFCVISLLPNIAYLLLIPCSRKTHSLRPWSFSSLCGDFLY